jgi:hypothetical protein
MSSLPTGPADDPWKLPRLIAGGLLVAVGILSAAKSKFFSLDVPSLTIILAGVALCLLPLGEIVRRLSSLKASTSGVELVLQNLSVDARQDLAGLSGHDIWALNDLVTTTEQYPVTVDGLPVPHRVMVRTFLDLNLMVVVGEGDKRIVIPTELPHQILRAAKELKI